MLNNGLQYLLELYAFENSTYTKKNSETISNTYAVNSLSLSYDYTTLLYTQDSNIKIMKKNSSGIFVSNQILTASETLYDSSISSDSSIVVASSKLTLYYYFYNSATYQYDLKQSLTLEPNTANSNTKGILDLSYDGSTLAYVTYKSKLNIAKLSSSLFSLNQTF